MARISRVVVSGYPHHVTQRGVRSSPSSKLKGIAELISISWPKSYTVLASRFSLGVCQSDALVKNQILLGLVVDWAEYLKGNDEWETQTTLIRGIRTGRPAGSEQIVEMIEKLTGRDLTRRKSGRPLKRAS
jgi:hypothetical protein